MSDLIEKGQVKAPVKKEDIIKRLEEIFMAVNVLCHSYLSNREPMPTSKFIAELRRFGKIQQTITKAIKGISKNDIE